MSSIYVHICNLIHVELLFVRHAYVFTMLSSND